MTFRTRFRQFVTRGKPLSVGNVLYVSLHTADPSEGEQTTAEACYMGYGRMPIPRTDGAWIELEIGEQAKERVVFNAGNEQSPTERLTHWALGTAPAGDGLILACGPLKRPITAGPGIAPAVRPVVT